jgi:hypothetical protein
MRDFITLYVRKEHLVEVWAEQLGEEVSRQTKAVVECATLDGERAGEYDRDHEMALPLHIEFGDHFYLLPLFGALQNPFFHMVNEIKRRYRNDWDRAVDLREARFRQDIREHFKSERYYVVPTGVVLRAADRKILTDIDAVVCDRETGDIALMQLKWNDVYARSLRERESRRRNLLEANAWVEKVANWQASLAKPVNQVLGLPQLATPVGKVLLFVVARNAIRFSTTDSYDDRAAWGIWASIARRPMNAGEFPLRHLWQELRGQRPSSEPTKSYAKSFAFGDLRVDLSIA